MSGLLPVTGDWTTNRVIQHESVGSIPVTREQSTTCPHRSTSTSTSHHFRIHHRSPSPPLIASPMARPAPFSGVAEECNGFLLQCSLCIENQPYLYTTERSKVSFLISLLSGKTLQWAETIWANITQSFDNFVSHFREVFGWPHGDPTASDQLYHLWQGSQPIKEYALRFRTLAAVSGWNERSLITTYRQGLEPRLRLQMASYDDNFGLETMIQHSIRCSSRMQSCFDEQTEAMRLAPVERQRRLSKGLCLYCGGGGHVMPHSSTSTTGEFHPTCSPEHVSTHSCGNAYCSPYHSSSSCPPRLRIRLRLPCKKLAPRYFGPFVTQKLFNLVTFQLKLPPQYRIHPTFHVSLLKPYHSPVSPSTEPGPITEPPLPLILEDGAVYEVIPL